MIQNPYLFLMFFIALLAVSCSKKQITTKSITPPTVLPANSISVLTQHNDNSRAGWNSHETLLNAKNVNSASFGRQFVLDVDDQVYAQPLVVSNLKINGGAHNVAYIATVNNSVYALDAENGNLFWKKSFTASGYLRPPRNTDMTGACGGGYQDFSGNIGIVGTPVIDSTAQVIYFVARSTNGAGVFIQQLHAVNIISGSELNGSPVEITASYPGTGDGSVNNQILFDPQRQNQRQALTLTNGIVFITWSSHCDWGPYHGWIIGYNSNTLQQKVVYNDTPDGSDGGIWESGTGLAVDGSGNLYAAVGNGTVGVDNDPTNVRNRGESALKLSISGSTLAVSSYFTPSDWSTLNDYDLDFGSIGSLLIPNSNYFFTGSKDGTLYLLNKDNMGGYLPSGNQVQQVISLNNPNANEHCQACYYKGATNEFVYVWSENDNLKAFPFNRSTNIFDVNNTVISPSNGPTGQNGALLSVSSNRSDAGTAILWASFANTGDAEHTVSPGILRAFDAGDITKELWNSNISPGDAVGNYAKFSTPTIANGHVYLATFSNQVVVYGLKGQ